MEEQERNRRPAKGPKPQPAAPVNVVKVKPGGKAQYRVSAGKPHPLGATPDGQGVNFAVFSRNATAVELLLFDEHDDPVPVQVIRLDPRLHKSFHVWHCCVHSLKPGTHYGYRVDGPGQGEGGHRFNPAKLLVDPYARGNTNSLWNRGDACGEKDNLATSMRSVVIDPQGYAWEGDRPLELPAQDLVIYEMHVGGFTRHPSSGVKHPGSFAALVEKIPYLVELGVTAVELLPVMEFDDTEVLRQGEDGQPLRNYWGYSTLGFFAPHRGFCVSPEEGTHLDEFRDMVKALHRAGIAVILDVVFNHSTEGNHDGPTISFKGLDNTVYYHLSPEDPRYYMNYSGCGNTMNCNHPVMDKFIVECLEFWVREMHIDGFRFDEGSILSRGLDGAPMDDPPVLWHLELSDELSGAHLICEAWDAGGLYQIGRFPGYRWAEWNGRYRDHVREFVKGDPGRAGALASRLCGSADLYQASGHLPLNSVNFVTCHDGFTLRDLVSYEGKHNQANGEDNRDGVNDNRSWNCGVEGETDDPEINALRLRQAKNFFAILMLSRGIPMLQMGDEVLRSQSGNNNTYCQDNELGWQDWSLLERNGEMFRFCKRLIDLRKRNRVLRSAQFLGEEVRWHGTELDQPPWNDPEARLLAYTLAGVDGEASLHVMINADWRPLSFQVPRENGGRWFTVVDTGQPAPRDAAEPGAEPEFKGERYELCGRSLVVLSSTKRSA